MDTSIIVVIAIIVVFVVAVPTMIRKSATELSRVEIDTVPDEAQVVTADPKSPGHDDTERARVFHSDATVEPTVPRPDVAPLTTVPTFTLSAPTPEFALIDGQADTRSTTDTDPTTAEAGPEHQRSVLPVAVGQTRSPVTDDLSTSTHRAAGSSGSAGPGSAAPGMRDNVRKLHPAVRAVFNESQQNTGGGRSTGGTNPARPAGGHLGDHSATGPVRSRSPQRGTPHDRSTGPSTTGTTTRGTQIPDPSFGADEDHSMSDKATRLRESKKSLGTMTRGFGLLLLASMLGVLVTGVLALFSVVHVALTGVFLGLAVVSLFIVRTLNLRKREIKARLRQLERPSAKRSGSRTKTEPQGPAAPKASNAPRANAAPTAAESKNGAQTAAAPRSEAWSAATRDGARSAVAAKPVEGRSAGSTKAAQARAVMQRNVTAKHDREEANTGEIPLVRIRNEAAEGHTTRQVLLTGPIPVVEEAAPQTAETGTAETGTAGTDTAQAAPTTESAPAAEASVSTASTPETSSSRDLGTAADSAVDKEPTAATADASTAETATTAENAETAEAAEAGGVDEAAEAAEADAVSDPFMQRLQAREGWSPTPLPVPSYVDAPRVEHPVPETKAADATSYETEARSREDIAAEFAAELGYRPELSDSAREDGPLEHGRKAIRTNKAPELGAVDDVLARRRA